MKPFLYLLKRAALALLTVWAVITVTFFAMRAVRPFLEGEAAAAPAASAAMEALYGPDRPLAARYLSYLRDAARLDFGPSLRQADRTVAEILARSLDTSVKLWGIAVLCALGLGGILGCLAALRRDRIPDRLAGAVTEAGLSMPACVAGSLLLAAFAAKLSADSLPSLPEVSADLAGTSLSAASLSAASLSAAPLSAASGGVSALLLPAAALALYPMACAARLARAALLDALGQGCLRTARAKGLSGFRTFFGCTLKTALLSLLPGLGPLLACTAAGSLAVERIFNLPGVGLAFVTAVQSRDYPLVMGTIIALASLYVGLHLVTGIFYEAADPRSAMRGGTGHAGLPQCFPVFREPGHVSR